MDKRIKEYLNTVIEIERKELDSKYALDEEEHQKFTPIETLFYIALMYHSREVPFTIIPNPQYQIENYRVDFCIAAEYFSERRMKLIRESVIVECDGHDYHERTKEQASKDKKRDRDLQKLGNTVFRFTGSDIWKDPDKCAREVLGYLENKIFG